MASSRWAGAACAKDVAKVVERVAFWRAKTRKSDKRSGVSKGCLSSVRKTYFQRRTARRYAAGKRRLFAHCDVYAALPSITGKLELEYEGERAEPILVRGR